MSAFGLTEDMALTLLTVACDFQVRVRGLGWLEMNSTSIKSCFLTTASSIALSQVHQVVDGNWGMGVSCPKYVFEGARKRYAPKVLTGSSVPL
jgi:hypothetical protein